MSLKIAILASTNGGAFRTLYSLLNELSDNRIQFIIITDRKCGIEDFALQNGLTCIRIEEKNNQLFSIKAKELLDQCGCVDFAILFFTRMITRELFNKYCCFNLHPSLLPAFKGLNSVKDAINCGVKFFGTTLHLVNEFIDEGKILAQTCMPICKDDGEYTLSRYSYIQKIYLCLLLIDLFENNIIIVDETYNDFTITKDLLFNDRCNPQLISNKYLNLILNYQKSLKVEVIK